MGRRKGGKEKRRNSNHAEQRPQARYTLSWVGAHISLYLRRIPMRLYYNTYKMRQLGFSKFSIHFKIFIKPYSALFWALGTYWQTALADSVPNVMELTAQGGPQFIQ